MGQDESKKEKKPHKRAQLHFNQLKQDKSIM